MALIDAALQIVRESGVKSVTHRKVCSYAGLAVGSSTYHYETIDALMLEAFSHYVETVSGEFEAHFTGVVTDDDLIDAIIDLPRIINSDVGNAILEWELLAEAARGETYHALARAWSERARAAVEAHVSTRTAYMLEIIWDGAIVQRMLNGNQLGDDDLRELIAAALALDPARNAPGTGHGESSDQSTSGRRGEKTAARTRKAAKR